EVTRHLTQTEYQKFTGGYGPLNTVNNVNDAAVVVMDAKTGEVLAMDGSSNYNSTDPRVAGQVNAAVALRQPGSTFKPIVYSTAFQMGWYPGMVLPDFKTYFPNGMPTGTSIDNCSTPKGKIYCPPDYGNSYHNMMSTIRVATANSFNVPAVKALEFAGVDNVVTTARRMGITDIDKKLATCAGQTMSQCLGVSLVLGTTEVSPLQMTASYQVFADNGNRVPPQGVLDIWDNYGHHLYHYDPTKPPAAQAMSPQVAYLMTSVLMDEPARALEFPGDHDLSFADQTPSCAYQIACPNQVAAKTGTTDSFRDNWTIGYTPNVVVGVWVGNADNEAFNGNVVGITGAAPIWHSVIERVSGYCLQAIDGVDCGTISSHYTQRMFTVPDGLQMANLSALDGLKGTGVNDLVIDGTQPMQGGAIQPNNNNDNNNNGDNGNGNGNGNNDNNGNGNGNGNGNNNGNNGN
ncbi:MAG TPA: penicillin-binding transpeptidase domain-containing protein, partial [Ktedonobacteraceae bacterium]|nr:penicillin-binding transpeptidase domain-containing protein [Ktedonobacteraceae bacterium]